VGTLTRLEKATDQEARKIKALLERNLRNALAALVDGGGTAIQRAIRGREAVEAASLIARMEPDQITEEVRASMRRLLAVAEEELARLGVSVDASAASAAAYRAHAQGAADILLQAIEGRGVDAVREALEVGSTSSAPLDRIVANVAQELRTTTTLAIFEVDTQLMAFDRLVLNRQAADDGFEFFLYDGPPPDGIIREFCEMHVEGIYTLAEMDRMNNGDNQPKPVSVYLGGYGCRHYLTPVTRAEAARLGRKV
jgi:hypothetical protein